MGQELKEILQLFDRINYEPIDLPLAKVLSQDYAIEPSKQTLLKSRDGAEFAVEHSVAPIVLSNGEIVGTVLVCRNITEAHKLARQLSWQAKHDSLTGLYNRYEFERQLEEAIANVKKKNHYSQNVVCYIDLDRFKIVNDTCGHLAGDDLLCQVSNLLKSQIRQTDVLARLGGDEFGLLLRKCSLEKGYSLASLLIEVVRQFRFVWQDKISQLVLALA